MSENIYPVWDKLVSRMERENFLNQRSACFWLTGLSGSGKSTIATAVERGLFNAGYLCQVLDGDNIRYGINNNLGFCEEDRQENIRRIAEIAKLYLNTGVITICSFISPTLASRMGAREIVGSQDFYEVYINTSLAECEKRDVKGLYKKARQGEITDFTGISSPYEVPRDPDLILNTSGSIEQSSEELFRFALNKVKII